MRGGDVVASLVWCPMIELTGDRPAQKLTASPLSERPMARIRIKRIAGDALLLVGAITVGVLTPVAVGFATSPKDAAAINEAAALARDKAVAAREDAIERELASVGPHAWAGEYYKGDGLGLNITIRLAPHNGMTAVMSGCTGTYGQSVGHVLPQRDGQLAFAFDDDVREGRIVFPDRMLPVRWGERRYLLTPDGLDAFVSAIQHGEEPRTSMWGDFLLAQGDDAKPVSGLPAFPGGYRPRIRDAEVTSRVSRVETLADGMIGGGMCEKSYRLHLTVDGDAPLRAGEVLKVVSAGNRAAFADIVTETASAGHATARTKVLELHCEKPEDVPESGWSLTTGAYDPVAANRAIAQAQREIATRKRERGGD